MKTINMSEKLILMVYFLCLFDGAFFLIEGYTVFPNDFISEWKCIFP